jgi:hypothetical protein
MAKSEPWDSDRPRLGTFYGLTIWFRPPLTGDFAITMGARIQLTVPATSIREMQLCQLVLMEPRPTTGGAYTLIPWSSM